MGGTNSRRSEQQIFKFLNYFLGTYKSFYHKIISRFLLHLPLTSSVFFILSHRIICLILSYVLTARDGNGRRVTDAGRINRIEKRRLLERFVCTKNRGQAGNTSASSSSDFLLAGSSRGRVYHATRRGRHSVN